MPTRYSDMLAVANALDASDFRGWVFDPGMTFQSPNKWWGDLSRRDFPHEGVDFCFYTDNACRKHRLGAGTRIPAMHDGRVRAVFDDYLGQALVVEHATGSDECVDYISIYAHTRPLDHIRPGADVTAGEIIATFADTSRSRARIPAHLHFTLGVPAAGLRYDTFVWNDMRNPSLMRLLDPHPLTAPGWPCDPSSV
jgi:murein DD-endopeptidase MepM/ murein hydrolase activator NlpD